MQAREYTEEDYPMLCDWWKSWGWACIPQPTIPKTGIIIENNGAPIYAGFIYSTDSNVCLFELFISDKNGDRSLKKGGLDMLIREGKRKAQKMGFRLIMSWVSEPHLMKTLRDNEIFPTDPDTTAFLGVI